MSIEKIKELLKEENLIDYKQIRENLSMVYTKLKIYIKKLKIKQGNLNEDSINELNMIVEYIDNISNMEELSDLRDIIIQNTRKN